jgi:hypothetical protein
MRGRVITAAMLTAAVAGGAFLAFRGPVDSGSAAPAGASSSATGSASASNGASPSTSSTGDGAGVSPTDPAQTGLPPITKLKKGEKPPQFVVLSFDGACKTELFNHYMQLAKQVDGHFTFFLSGLCEVPDRQRFLYKPPHKPVGYSAIGFGEASLIPQRIRDITAAYNAGNEIGTHFLGHFCDAKGVGIWSSADWTSEITQARYFLDHWAEVNGNTDPSLKLPFDSHVWKGARTPCLAGKSSQMFPVWKKQGFTYDASRTGSLTWPKKVPHFPSMWEFPLQRIKIVGYNKSNLSMDYNLLYVQNKAKQTAPPATCARIQKSAYQSYMQALAAVHGSNRAPFFIGNHFNTWVCGAYVNALTQFATDAKAKYPDVQFVTFAWLAKWMSAQDPKVLATLQAKPAPKY